MKNLLLLVLTMAAVTSCIAPRIVNFKAVPNATVLEAKCDGDAYKIVGRDMVISRMNVEQGSREFGQLRAHTSTDKISHLAVVATIVDSCYVEFTGTVKSGGYSWNAKNSSEIMKIGWNELVYVVEDGTCAITGSRVR
tara:strand:+ start:279 stop:692 length:414 start_codon:yes stop_codon:yes gene_type:complete